MMRPRPTVLALLCAALVSISTTESFAQTSDEARCRATIAKSLARYVKASHKAILGCHNACAKGKRSGDCDQCNNPTVADEKGKVDDAAVKLRSSVSGSKARCDTATMPDVLVQYPRCPSPGALTDDGGATTGIDDFDELAECLLELARASTEQLGAQALGRTGRNPQTGKEIKGCHRSIGKAYTKYVEATMKEIARCQRDEDKLGGTVAFDCLGRDDDGRIAEANDKALSKIAKRCGALDAVVKSGTGAGDPCDPDPCGGSLVCVSNGDAYFCYGDLSGMDEVGSCGDTVAQIQNCIAIKEEGVNRVPGDPVPGVDVPLEQIPRKAATRTGAALAAMAFELPQECPVNAVVMLNAGHGLRQTDTSIDVGFVGFSHDIDGADRSVLSFALACDADCGSCPMTLTAGAGNCRCEDDPTVLCDEPFVADVDDCGGATCSCHAAPPAPIFAGGLAYCTRLPLESSAGTLDVGTGDVALQMGLAAKVHFGNSGPGIVCPTCDENAGLCIGGERDGLPCIRNHASYPGLGRTSYECPPAAVSKISDSSFVLDSQLATADASISAGSPCDFPLQALTCTCAMCSGDPTISCNSNAECAAVGAGSCDDDGGGASRVPNECSGFACDTDSQCTTGPDDQYCDGFVLPTGAGVVSCISNSDCTLSSWTQFCSGGDCGTCTLLQRRRCLADPIDAHGIGGPFGGTLASVSCAPPLTPLSTGFLDPDGIFGFAGPMRIEQQFDLVTACANGEEFEGPSGSNCAVP